MGYKTNLADKEYGRWTVVRFAGNTKSGGSIWLCRCACGVEREIPLSNLGSGNSTQCRDCATWNRKQRTDKNPLVSTSAYKFWSRRRSDFVPRWENDVELFISECYQHRLPGDRLIAPDPNHLIGPGNFRWLKKMDELRERAAMYYADRGHHPVEARKRARSISKQRLYQINNRLLGLCECGSRLGRGRDGCTYCRAERNRQKIAQLLENGWMTLAEAKALTGHSYDRLKGNCQSQRVKGRRGGVVLYRRSDVEALIVPAGYLCAADAIEMTGGRTPRFLDTHCRSRKIGKSIFYLSEDVESLIPPEGWVKISHAESNVSSATIKNRVNQGLVPHRRIGGQVFVPQKLVRRIERSNRGR